MSKFLKFSFSVVIVFVILLASCKGGNNNGTNTEANDKEFNNQLNKLLSEIVVELKSPKKVELTPRRFIELSSIIVVSNYYWDKELIEMNQSRSNELSQEEIENYISEKKQKLLEAFGISVDEFENYAVEHQKEFQEFVTQNKDLIDKYNTLSSMIPTFEN